MLNRLKDTLARLRGSLSKKTEAAYEARETAKDSHARVYAEGQATAYADAEEDVREAQKEAD